MSRKNRVTRWRHTAILLLMMVFLLGNMNFAARADGLITRVATGSSSVEQAQESVVRVLNFGRDSYLQSTGSGFIVGEKSDAHYVVTNYHVIEGSSAVCVTVTDGYGQIDTEIIYKDASLDIAILEMEEPIRGRSPIALLSADNVHKTQSVWALGFPGIADVGSNNENLSSTIDDITITHGTVSNNLFVSNGEKFILSEITVNPGNSGGPMVDEFAQVVGINTGVLNADATGDLNNMTMAIHIDYVMDILDDLGIDYIHGSEDGTQEEDTDENESDINILLYVGIGAAVLSGAIAVVVLLTLRRKSAQMQHQGQSNGSNYGNGGELYGFRDGCEAKTVSSRIVVTCERGPNQGQQVSGTRCVRIGRDEQTCQMAFPRNTAGVSREHCEITLEGNRLRVRDLNSSYGTYLASNERIQNSALIRSEDLLLIGSDHVIVSVKIVDEY